MLLAWRDLPELQKSEEWFARHGLLALVVCRFIPGTRLPTFLAAGLLGMPIARFAVGHWLSGRRLGRTDFYGFFRWFEVRTDLARDLTAALQLGGVRSSGAGMIFLTRTRWLPAARRLLEHPPAFQRWSKWEFWPAWLFLFSDWDQLSTAVVSNTAA